MMMMMSQAAFCTCVHVCLCVRVCVFVGVQWSEENLCKTCLFSHEIVTPASLSREAREKRRTTTHIHTVAIRTVTASAAEGLQLLS